MRSINQDKIREAVRLFLEGIGEDVDREGLQETPDRIVRMSEELFAGMDHEADEHLQKTFSTRTNGMVLVKDIRFYSMCEHHMMPFFGYAHIAYMPDGKVTGLSKLGRCVDTYARRLQIQENLTFQIMEAVDRVIKPKGVMVMLEAEHMCMAMRGIKKDSSKTVTTAACGCFEDDMLLRESFFRSVSSHT